MIQTNRFVYIKEHFFESTKLSWIQRNFYFDRISKKCFFDSKILFSGAPQNGSTKRLPRFSPHRSSESKTQNFAIFVAQLPKSWRRGFWKSWKWPIWRNFFEKVFLVFFGNMSSKNWMKPNFNNPLCQDLGLYL